MFSRGVHEATVTPHVGHPDYPLDVATTLQVALSEQRLGYFIRGGQQYEVIAQLEGLKVEPYSSK